MAAPAGHPPENIRKAAPVKPVFLTVFQAAGFGHTPFHKRVLKFPNAMGFIGGDADIMNHRVVSPQISYIVGYDLALQPPGAPALLGAGPA